MPEGVEGFLEREGADRFEVVFEQVAQLGGLPDGEVGPALGETIPGVSEDGFVAVGGELFGFLASDFINGLAEFLGDVEAARAR